MGADSAFVHAIECPENYVPIGNGVTYVWVPSGSSRRRYRARVDTVNNGYEWIDYAPSGNGAMLILTLPPNYVFAYPDGNEPVQFPVRFKSTDDCRMVLYWWLPPGRFEITWHMEYSPSAAIENQCRLLNKEARKRLVNEPEHIDRLQKNIPSDQPQVINEPPEWHNKIVVKDQATLVLGQREVNVKVEGDKFENVSNSIIATRGSIAKGIIKVREIEGDEAADALQQLDQIISQVKPDEMSDEQKEKALELLKELTNQAYDSKTPLDFTMSPLLSTF